MLTRSRSFVVLALLGVAFPGVASAHHSLTSPPPRQDGQADSNALKRSPCGQRQGQEGRTSTVTALTAGETITLEWNEYIPHTGYFRIAFDIDGDDDFPERANSEGVNPATDDPTAEHPVGDVVLAYIDSRGGGAYAVDVELPDVDCENCTLQVIQFMYDHIGNGIIDETYYQCADVTLTRSSVSTTEPADGSSSGESTTDVELSTEDDGAITTGTSDTTGDPLPATSGTDADTDAPGGAEAGIVPPAEDPEASGCACTLTGHGPAVGLWLLALGVVAPRKRPRPRG